MIGENLPRVDIPAKVTGGEAYVQDMRLPGMLHARVVRGPSDGTRLKPADIAAVAKMPGVVKVVRDGRFTAVVADDEWRAVKALHRLQAAGWERAGEPLPAKDMREAIRGMPAQDVPIFDYPGPPAPADAHTLRARYSRPYLMHGSIGPSCAVALWEDDSVTVWTHSQGVYPLRKALAELLGLPLERVRCVHVEGSGCYGHNGADDVAADAALAARAVPGQPVRLQWMREQEHGWEPLGSAMIVEMSASLGADGRIVGWQHDVWSNTHSTRPTTAGGLLAGTEVDPPFVPPKPRPIPMPEGGAARNGNPIYALPNARGTFHFVEQMPVRVSALRGLGAQMNVFAIESFMDELARPPAPIRWRSASPICTTSARATSCRWRPTASAGQARGRGTGFAFARYKNLASHCAVAMEVRIDRDTRRDPGAARGRRGRQRRGGQPRRHPQPDRGRHRAVAELDHARGGGVRRDPSHQLRLERLSDPALPRGARPDRGPCDRPAEAALPRRRRGGAGARGGGARQCRRPCAGHPPARHAAVAGADQGRAQAGARGAAPSCRMISATISAGLPATSTTTGRSSAPGSCRVANWLSSRPSGMKCSCRAAIR